MDKFLEKYLETLYRKGNKFFMGDLVHDPFTEEQTQILSGFHAREVYHVTKEDDYFCGIRANNFVVEYGWSEYYDTPMSIEDNEPINNMYLITGNHKGYRATTLLVEDF